MTRRRTTTMYELAKRLFPLNRSLTGDGIEASYRIFCELHKEFKWLSFSSGEKVFDWTVPPVWNLRTGYIEGEDGKKYCNLEDLNLHVVGYSSPVDKIVEKADLMSHIYTREDLPDAVPYVTSYYQRNWGFCMSYSQYQELKGNRFRCYIDSDFVDGKMNLIEAVIPGETEKEIFFSSYLCHPSMANNELSGPVLISGLMDFIKGLSDRRYTYRFVLLPETIGSIAYLSRRWKELKDNMIMGFNISCVGDNRRFTYLRSRRGNTLADEALSSALLSREDVYVKGFEHRGSDERQYNSPKIDLPVCGFSRSKFGDYPEYHTSLDNMSLISEEGLQGSLSVLQEVIQAAELGIYPEVTCYCEPHLSTRGLYPSISSCNSLKTETREVTTLSVRMDILAHSDGETSIFEFPQIAGCSLSNIIEELRLLSKAGLIVFRDHH